MTAVRHAYSLRSMTWSMGRAARREQGSVVLLLVVAAVVCALSPAVAVADDAPDCPNPRNPSADYLCPIGPSFLVPGLTDLAGWNKPDHYRTILYGDLDGDGADEMVARGVGGVEVYRFRADAGQWSQVAVAPILPDRDGWSDPKYNRTMRLGDVDGDGKAELVIRSKDGVIVFRYRRGSSPDKGSWTQVTTSGPFTDPGWGARKYYSTIELSPIGRVGSKPTMQLVARGALGLGTWRWNGAGWTPLTGLTDLSDANGWDDPAYYLNIMAWDPSLLLARGPDGVRVYRYTAQAGGPGSWKLLTASGPCPAVPDRGNEVRFLCDPDTIELARGIPGVASGDPVLLARASGPGQGLRLTPFDVSRGVWRFGSAGVGPWHEKAYDEPRFRRTIQAADIDGDGHDEVIGRIPAGMVVFQPQITRLAVTEWGNVQSYARPALADDPWAEKPYYETIRTARLDPQSKAASLLARGPAGIRTWRFNTNSRSFARAAPYGDYPAVDAKALEGLTDFLGIQRGTIRDVYTERTGDPTADRLHGYQDSIAARCTDLLSGSPPRYRSCSPPGDVAGVSGEAWTKASNQIVAELFWARAVVAHFAQVDAIQTRLFLDQNAEFPSLRDDLKIAAAQSEVATVDYKDVVGTIVGIVADLEIPYASKIAGAAGAVSALATAFTPVLSGEQPTELDQNFAEVQRHVAVLQQETRDAITAQRRYVLGDYGLLSTVGRLIDSRVWQLDTQAALSGGRQGFTQSMYQAFLPRLWDRWEVTDCTRSFGRNGKCFAPSAGPLLRVSETPNRSQAVDISGLLPRQRPCATGPFGDPYGTCRFQTLEDAGYGTTAKTLSDPVSAACRYDPVAETSWRYGCSLGVGLNEIAGTPEEPSPWKFRTFRCNAFQSVTCIRIQPR